MTLGVGARNNNAGNVRCLAKDNPYGGTCVATPDYNGDGKPDNGSFQKFETIRDGIYANTDLYVRLYSGMEPDAMTWKWARAQSGSYYEALSSCFN